MSRRVISEPVDRESVEFTLFFENPEHKTSGYSFDCDEHGNVFRDRLQPLALENYEKMLADNWPSSVRRFEHHWKEPAVIECDCGTHLELYSSWANSCQRCGREYNGSGQLLANRSEWGQETGETFAARNWSNDE